MRILQLGKFYPIRGGVEKVMWDLTRGLSQRGVRCDMLCADLEGKKNAGTVSFEGSGRAIVLPTWFKAAGTMICPAMILWLRRHRKDYDIVHIHHPDPMACLALWCSGFKGKVILHWHSDILSQKFFLMLYRPLQSWLIRRADTIVGTTPVYVKESHWLQKVQGKTTFAPIGIDPMPVDPEGAQRIQDEYPGKKIVFSLGRLVPYKGFEYLVDAAGYLPEDYHVIIGGKGPLEETLDKKILRNNLKNRLTLLGYVDDKDIPAYFGASKIFVLSSVMKTEAFGIVQIEAMSLGKPVVATNIPESGVSWVNQDGSSGLNVSPRDPEAIAGAIRLICGDEKTYSEFSAKAQKRFEENFTLKMMTDKVLEIYENSI